MVDRFQGENEILRQRVDALYNEDLDDERHRPTLIARLEEIIQMARDRSALMIPHHERESLIVLTAIAGELRRVIMRLRAHVSPASTASPSP